MNITEVENLTGIPKQNIRYYEKEGLISPKRNKLNSYREYTDADVYRLKLIRVLRKAGMSLSDIHDVLSNKITFSDAILQNKRKLEQEQAELTASLALCDKLETSSMESMDVDYYLNWIYEEEQKGNKLYQLWEDYRDVYHAESLKSFVFMPDDMITTPQEFTEQLLLYAKERKADITITKESMYPEFIWNGIEYSAYRTHHRYGAVVHCKILHPEEIEPQHINPKRKKFFKFIRLMIPFLFIAVYIGTLILSGYTEEGSPGMFIFFVAVLVILALVSWLPYIRKKH